MADIQKFLDSAGVSTLWGQVAAEITAKVSAEKSRAEAAEKVNADAIAALDTFIGDIPEGYTQSNIVAFIQKRAEEVLTQASGGSSESAASVLAALNTHKSEADGKFKTTNDAIAAIQADYLKAVDKTALEGSISDNADEIARIDAALKLAVENNTDGIDSIKELANWVNTHGTAAAGYAAAIDALEALVGSTAVAAQIANAIAAENLAQYAKTADISAKLNKVDTQGTVTEAINAAIAAIKIGDYAKAADLTALATRVSNIEKAGYQTAAQVSTAIESAINALNLAKTYEAKGAAASALTDAKAYTDSEITRRIVPLTTVEVKSACGKA